MPSRDLQAHNQIDDDELWQVVERDLPDLIPSSKPLLPKFPSS